MTRFGHRLFATMVALVVLAATVVCPCAVGIFSDVGHGRAVMSCCDHSGGGQPGKDSGDKTCKAFCSTRVMDHAKVASVDFSPLHFVGVVEMPAVTGVLAGLPVQGQGWDVRVPREAASSLLRLHCALLV